MALSKRFIIAQAYSRIYGFLKQRLNIHIRGLGFVLRRLKSDRVLLVRGRKIYFSHALSEAYARPIYGFWNEPETHEFISFVLDKNSAAFVDVGANIGEILIDIAAHPSCIYAVGFEPNPKAADVIRKNIELNELSNCSVVCKALGDIRVASKMSFGSHSPSASLMQQELSNHGGIDVEISTLDFELTSLLLQRDRLILLVDVEGYELNVVRGGKDIIVNLLPLIIFEFHQKTRISFSMADIRSQLGDAYEIYRLRHDAMLDKMVDAAWNCVAVPIGSDFERIVSTRIL